MKKIMFAMLIMVLSFVFLQSTCYAKSKINVYLFRGEGCPHCEEAIEWFENVLANDEEYSKYYELVKYEVWYDKDNSQLMSDVADELGTEASGVPFIVIGDKYFSGFSATTSPEQLKNAIKEQYDSKEYTDVVAAVKKGISIDKKNEKNSILPIVIVSSIAVVVVLALVFFTKEK